MTVHNFYSGPAVLPKSALVRAQQELFNFSSSGMSVMEISHRSKEFNDLILEAESLLRQLLKVPGDYHVVFLPGGASLQFDLIPLNFLGSSRSADYILTGGWAERAFEEASKVGSPRVAFSGKTEMYRRIPQDHEISFDPNASYVHLTSNNTLYGTQWRHLPECNGVPLIADMSSDIASYPIDISKYSMIYAGAQKNLGPSGLVVAIIQDKFLSRVPENLPTMFSYRTHCEHKSLFNTPNTWGIYMLRNVLAWIQQEGGVEALSLRNTLKAQLVYELIDKYPSFYLGHADKESRSLMNITWALPNKALEDEFLKGAESRQLIGLKGYRTVGGIRASVYNALPVESVKILASYMDEFATARA